MTKVKQNHGALAVDLAGLRQLVERRGKSFALLELLQNAWDEPGVNAVTITTLPIARGLVQLVVQDDAPEGFHDLSHAYTLFASSRKKADPELRGRFNVGEKLVIALASEFTVETTTGGVHIDVTENTRTMLRKKRETGSRITASLRMTREELDEAIATFRTVLPPRNVVTTLNGETIAQRAPVASTRATLATEIADDHGFLRPTKRSTQIEIVEPLDGETGTLYELGIPVVATGDRYHVNVLQKVPLNSDRDNVPPSFLRDVRAIVLNAMADALDGEQAAGVWVNDALEDELVNADAVSAVMTRRFGDKRVTFDLSDPEANRSALAAGYTVVPSNTFTRVAWDKVREAGTTPPAGRLFASPKPFHEDGSPLTVIPESDYTPEQRRFARDVARLHRDLVGRPIAVVLANDHGWGFAGAYGGGRIILNVVTLEPDVTDEHTLQTVLHEFGHAYGAHLTHDFDDGIARVAAKLVVLAIEHRDYFKEQE